MKTRVLRKNTIAFKLLAYIVAFSSLLTLLLTAAQLYLDYRRDIRLIEERMSLIQLVSAESIADSLWTYDLRNLTVQLDGLQRSPDVQYLEVRTKGEVFLATGAPKSTNVLSRSYPLVHTEGDRESQLGELLVIFTLENVHSRLWQRVLIVLMSNCIKTFAVAGFMLFIIHHLVTRHLARIARHANEADPSGTREPMRLDRRGGDGDELDEVVQAINSSQQASVTAVHTLRTSEERFRRLFENSEVSIWHEDLSEVHEALGQLRQAGVDDLRQYLEQNKQVAWDLAARVKVIDVNEATLRLFGQEDEGRTDFQIEETFGPNAIEVFIDELCAISDKKRVFRAEANFRTFDGRELDTIVSFQIPETAEGFKSIPVAVMDITERKQLERQLLQSQKMEAVGQLAGGVAHDFNNILTAILGNVGIGLMRVREELGADHDLMHTLKEVEKAADLAAALTRQLLTFSRRDLMQPRVLNLNDVLCHLDEMLRRLISEDIALESILDPSLESVRADAGQLEQVIVNLVVNAAQAMPDGGRLLLETRSETLGQASTPDDVGLQPGDYVVLLVSDTGHGMDLATRERIFEPFFSTKPMEEGSGLGLATVHGIIERSGGHISVSSEKGGGTTFKIFLPALVAAPTPVRAIPAEDVSLTGEETILLCEDDQSVRDLTAAALKNSGYTVLTSSNGQSGIEALMAHADPIDLLVTDVIMPDMNGRALAERASELRPGLPVLFMSGYTSDIIAHHGVLDEGVEFLEKPFSRTELLRKVRAVLGGTTAAEGASPPADFERE